MDIQRKIMLIILMLIKMAFFLQIIYHGLVVVDPNTPFYTL